MRRDILYGRYTEIDYITGYLLQRARYHGILLPEHIHVYSLVKQKRNKMPLQFSFVSLTAAKKPKPSPPLICWSVPV